MSKISFSNHEFNRGLKQRHSDLNALIVLVTIDLTEVSNRFLARNQFSTYEFNRGLKHYKLSAAWMSVLVTMDLTGVSNCLDYLENNLAEF